MDFFLATRLFFICWYWYFPKSIILQTGGSRFGATSTRSSLHDRASARACSAVMIPACLPSLSMVRTALALI